MFDDLESADDFWPLSYRHRDISNVRHLDYTADVVGWEGSSRKPVYHTIMVAVATLTDHPRSYHNF